MSTYHLLYVGLAEFHVENELLLVTRLHQSTAAGEQ